MAVNAHLMLEQEAGIDVIVAGMHLLAVDTERVWFRLVTVGGEAVRNGRKEGGRQLIPRLLIGTCR